MWGIQSRAQRRWWADAVSVVGKNDLDLLPEGDGREGRSCVSRSPMFGTDDRAAENAETSSVLSHDIASSPSASTTSTRLDGSWTLYPLPLLSPVDNRLAKE